MKELAALDDARKVCVMAWSVLGAVPLVLVLSGIELILRYATLHANGGDVRKAAGNGSDFPFIVLALVFFSLTSGTTSGTTFRRLALWFVASELVADVVYLGLLAALGFGIDPAVGQAAASLITMPLAVLGAFWLFRRRQRRSS